ncbi:MAG: AsmA family protein [Gammaproteobacteria bacterium]|nr:AsmA family protein [Gammaproteobacteria bacterium]
MIRRLLVTLLGLLLLSGGFVFYWIQDANRFKPELEALIEEQTGVPVRINGDLAWRLFPPLSLTARSVTADVDGVAWTVGYLALDLDVMTIIQTRDVDRWRIQSLTLNDVTMADDSGRLDVHALTVSNFAVGAAAPVTASLIYTPVGSEPIPLELTALVAYQTNPTLISIADANFSSTAAAGVCNLEATPTDRGAPGPAPMPKAGDLIPVEIWRSYDWHGQCDFEQLNGADYRFEDATVVLANNGGSGENVLRLPEFFGGNATVTLAIDARRDPILWKVTPDLQEVDSQRLMAWLDQRLQWIAPLAFAGTLELEGNTTDELIASLSGETSFDGGHGAISIAKIKQPLLAIATLLQEPDKISSWPDVWDYERFVGNWRIDKQHHIVEFALDNLTVLADGDYDARNDDLDILAELTFETLPEGRMFEVNPLLMDLPIPVRCRGALESPNCGIDEKAAQRLVASMLTSREGSAMREKLDQKIEEKVPEEYRDAARSFLDLLGGVLENSENQD